MLLVIPALAAAAGCSPGFTTYTDVGSWRVGMGTGSGKHCLEGTASSPITIADGTALVIPSPLEVEAHHVTFRDFSGVNGAFMVIGGTFSGTSCSFISGEATNGGAVFNNADGSFACTSCDFTGNSAVNGGASSPSLPPASSAPRPTLLPPHRL